MADVHPFRGWRYDLGQVGDLSEVTAPPYDVIGPDQQRDLYERHPCNVIRLILNRDEPGDTDPEARYKRAAKFLRHWQSEGILIPEHEDALYVYHQEFDWEGRRYVRKGFLARVRIEEFGRGKIYPHEQTLSGPKADRLALTKACRMNLSPVFGLYPGEANEELDSAIQGMTPLVAVDHLGVIHRMWPVTEVSVINEVRAQLRAASIFIADSSSGVRLSESFVGRPRTGPFTERLCRVNGPRRRGSASPLEAHRARRWTGRLWFWNSCRRRGVIRPRA